MWYCTAPCALTVAVLQHSQFSSAHNVSRAAHAHGFGSSPHIARDIYALDHDDPPQFYLHDSPAQPPQHPQHPPAQAPRRTWAQHAQHAQHAHHDNTELRGWQVFRSHFAH